MKTTIASNRSGSATVTILATIAVLAILFFGAAMFWPHPDVRQGAVYKVADGDGTAGIIHVKEKLFLGINNEAYRDERSLPKTDLFSTEERAKLKPGAYVFFYPKKGDKKTTGRVCTEEEAKVLVKGFTAPPNAPEDAYYTWVSNPLAYNKTAKEQKL